jgi:outer membrane protein OmpA-like peptidoglycan-associated protein
MATSFGNEPYQPIRKGQYQLVIRTFAPFKEFVLGYKGDDRDFSTSESVGFRTGAFLVLDVKRGYIQEGPVGKSSGSAGPCAESPARQAVQRWVNATRHAVDVSQGRKPAAAPAPYYDCRAWTQVSVQKPMVSDGFPGELGFRLWMTGSDPLVPDLKVLPPNIDTFLRFGARLERQILCVKGTVQGDDYPNTELFIRDSSRKAVMLFKYRTDGGPAGVHNLYFANRNDVLGSFEMSFTLDQNGCFRTWKRWCQKCAGRDDDRLSRVSQPGYENPVLPADALFAFDSDQLKAGADRLLKPWVAVMNQNKNQRYTIIGHTDSTGDREYNKGLSVRRAVAVQAWLIKAGVVHAIGFAVVGKGMDEAIASNASDGGRQKNRRVEIRASR